MLSDILTLVLVFLKIGFIGFGGGYAMMSLIMSELDSLNISVLQFADLNALDMIVPGPIMINAATYVGFINSGFWGAAAATAAVTVPSFIYVNLVMRFSERFSRNITKDDLLSGIKPAAVGLIAASAMTIGAAVIIPDGGAAVLFSPPFDFADFLPALIFAVTAAANIRFKVNPILLTVLAGILGALFL